MEGSKRIMSESIYFRDELNKLSTDYVNASSHVKNNFSKLPMKVLFT